MLEFSETEINALLITIKVSLWGLFFTSPIAIFFAWLLSRKNFFGKNVLNAILHLPLVIPPVVIGYILIIILGREGFLGKILYESFNVTIVFSWQAASIASSVVAFPLFLRPIRQAFETINPQFEEAAFTLGANKLNTYFFITLPILIPGIINGALLFVARAIGEFGATITFAANIPGVTQTIPLALYSATMTPNGESLALRLIMISLLLAFSALIISEWLTRRHKTRVMDV